MRCTQLLVAALAFLPFCYFADARAQAAASSSAVGGGADAGRRVVATGGDEPGGEGRAVRGTIALPEGDASHPAWSGAFALTGGSWASAEPGDVPGDPLFANGLE